MEFGVLGPVQVLDGDRALPVGGARERAVLAMLLLHDGRLVPTDRLVDVLWQRPPPTARAQLHNLVSRWRRRVGHELIVTKPSGYELHLGEHALDLLRFRELVSSGRLAAERGDHARVVTALAAAARLWRGDALAGLPHPVFDNARQALHEDRLAAAEARLGSELALGRHDDVLRALPGLVERHPYRERLHEARLLAMAGAGREEDALAAAREVTRLFVDGLGVPPGPRLRELAGRIARGEPAALDPVPGTLPRVDGVFTGRDKLLAEIRAELAPPSASPPVVVLTGPGGVGKTALALVAATGLPYDGHLYADLRGSHEHPAEPLAVMAGFLRALGAAPAVPEDVDERTAAYTKASPTSCASKLTSKPPPVTPTRPSTCVHRSMERWRQGGVPLEMARIHARLERAHHAAGDLVAAAANARECRTILTDLGLDEPALRLPPP